MQGLLGIVFFVGVAWFCSEKRSRTPWRVIPTGLGLQFALTLLLLKVPGAKSAFMGLNNVVLALEQATRAGTSFVFGYLGGGPLPFSESYPGASFILATQALPLVLVISAVSALLFHWRVLPFIVNCFAVLLRKTMGVGGALGVAVSANIFIGMIEAPILVRPYLAGMTRCELFTLMTTGMATIAGTVMALYASFLRPVLPDAVGHILVASIISVPAAVLIARIMVPPGPEDAPRTEDASFMPAREAVSSMDAVTRGTAMGVQLFINIAAMLIVLVALVSLCNQVLGFLPDVAGAPITLESIFGVVLSPVAWLMGVPWCEAGEAGKLLGMKTVLNELLAYLRMGGLPEGALSLKSRVIMTYAMCGFANFGSLGIMIGGLSTMLPERRPEIASLGMRSIFSGLLATCMTGAVVGIFY